MDRSTSSAEVRQLQTLTRMARLPRQVVPPKNASPEATIAAITSSVRRSWSCSVATGDRSRSVESPFFDLPTALCQQRVTRRRETGHMGHLATSYKCEARVRRESENVFQPESSHFFDHSRRRRVRIEGSILVHVVVSQSAARAAGKEPPMTQPKRRIISFHEAEFRAAGGCDST